MIEVGKYNRENTNADFDSDLVVEGVILELQSLSSLLKIFLKIFKNVFNDKISKMTPKCFKS